MPGAPSIDDSSEVFRFLIQRALDRQARYRHAAAAVLQEAAASAQTAAAKAQIAAGKAQALADAYRLRRPKPEQAT